VELIKQFYVIKRTVPVKITGTKIDFFCLFDYKDTILYIYNIFFKEVNCGGDNEFKSHGADPLPPSSMCSEDRW
jgi:hypothetical protein